MINKKISASGIRSLIKCVAFLLLFATVLCVLSWMMKPKGDGPYSGMDNHMAHGFYGEPENSLDVVGMGNSNMACGFSPLDLWKKYGYTGYNSGEAGANIFQTYDLLTELLACQKPEVIFLDADGLFPTGGQMDTFGRFVHWNLARYFPLIEYHNLWRVQNPKDLLESPQYDWTSLTKGYSVTGASIPFLMGNKHPHTDIEDRITFEGRFQANAFADLCKRKNVKLVLLYLPTGLSWNINRHDAVNAFAASKKLPFIDMNTDLNGIRLDWGVDTRDGGVHLNYYGAQKVTKFLGSYLQNQGYLPAHQTKAVFQRWQKSYSAYQEVIRAYKEASKG